MDKMKHPKRYKAYLEGYENGKKYEINQYLETVNILQENYEKYESKNVEIRKQLELSKDANLDYYRYIKELEMNIKDSNKRIPLEKWSSFILGITVTSLFYLFLTLFTNGY